MKSIAIAPRSTLVPERFCLLVAITMIVASTLAPFEFSFSLPDLRSRTEQMLQMTHSGGVFKFMGHFVAFFILGALMTAVNECSLKPRGIRRFAAIALLFCAGLELVQLLQEFRHARITDLLINYSGVLAGAISAISWRPVHALRVTLQKRVHRAPLGFQIGICVLVMSVWFYAGFRPVLGSLRMDWNDEYHLVIANEPDGSRPWRGEIRYIGVYDRALSSEQVKFALGHLGSRRNAERFSGMGLLAGYDFTRSGGNEISPEGLVRSDGLIIHVPETCEWTGKDGGILVNAAAGLATRAPASHLTDAIRSSGAFSVEAWIRPLNEVQGGPARIVTLSDGIQTRNFTLGQEAGDGVFRVRNGVNGSHGNVHALRVKNVFRASVDHLVAVYDHGVSSIFRNGQPLSPTVDLREPHPYLLLGTGEGGRAVGACAVTVFFALPAGSISSVLGFGVWRHLIAVGFTFCAGSLPYVVTCLWIGGPWRLNHFFWLVMSLVGIYPLCVRYACPGKAHCYRNQMAA